MNERVSQTNVQQRAQSLSSLLEEMEEMGGAKMLKPEAGPCTVRQRTLTPRSGWESAHRHPCASIDREYEKMKASLGFVLIESIHGIVSDCYSSWALPDF